MMFLPIWIDAIWYFAAKLRRALSSGRVSFLFGYVPLPDAYRDDDPYSCWIGIVGLCIPLAALTLIPVGFCLYYGLEALLGRSAG
jgi:hypothetical protein